MNLADLITAICARCGVSEDRVNTSLLPEVDVGGLLVTNQYPASEALQALGQIFKFDVVSYDGKIHFIPRGGDAVATITEDDLVDDGEEEVTRSDTIQIPRKLHLNYHDVDSTGLSTSKQTSERAGDRRAIGEMSIQSAVVMDADLAAQSAVIAHKVMIEEQKGQVKVSLPDSYLWLTPGDPIISPVNGVNARLRIHDAEILDGYQRYTCLRDRQSAFTSDVEGIPPNVIPAPPSQVVGPTVLVVLDIPLLQDADDAAGMAYYAAVSGVSSGWRGAVVEVSYDGGATYVSSKESAVPAVIGVLTASLPTHAQGYPDLTNTLSVGLLDETAELEPTDLAGMLNRANLAAIGNHEDGWELINFAGAVQDSNGEWQLSTLLRGRKGTQPRQHDEGDFFVLLDRSVLGFEPASVADIGQTMTFRATSSGLSTDTGTVVTVVYQGNVQVERKVGYLMATPTGSNVEVSWQGVGRLGGGSSALHGNYFTGYRVTFDDGSNQIVVDTTSESITQDVSSLAGAITVRVQQLNALTGPGPSVEVII